MLFIGCNNQDKTFDQLSAYYHEYLIALGESSSLQVQVVATFHKGEDIFGKAQELTGEYAVYLDSLKLPLDKEIYPVYSAELDRKGFQGNHKWQIKKDGRLVLEVPFTFSVFKLNATIEKIIGSKDPEIPVSGLKDGEMLECWFDNFKLENETDRFAYKISGGLIIILAEDMQKLKQDDYNLKVSYIQKNPVIYNGKTVGASDVSYSLSDIPVTVKY